MSNHFSQNYIDVISILQNISLKSENLSINAQKKLYGRSEVSNPFFKFNSLLFIVTPTPTPTPTPT